MGPVCEHSVAQGLRGDVAPDGRVDVASGEGLDARIVFGDSAASHPAGMRFDHAASGGLDGLEHDDLDGDIRPEATDGSGVTVGPPSLPRRDSGPVARPARPCWRPRRIAVAIAPGRRLAVPRHAGDSAPVT